MIPQEWGNKGVEKANIDGWIPAPRLHGDKLRGNDTRDTGHFLARGRGCPSDSPIPPKSGRIEVHPSEARLRRAGGLGVSPDFLISPKSGAGELEKRCGPPEADRRESEGVPQLFFPVPP